MAVLIEERVTERKRWDRSAEQLEELAKHLLPLAPQGVVVEPTGGLEARERGAKNAATRIRMSVPGSDEHIIEPSAVIGLTDDSVDCEPLRYRIHVASGAALKSPAMIVGWHTR